MPELEGTPVEGSAPPDTEMAEATAAEGTRTAEETAEASAELPFAEEEGVEEARQTFMSYLMSPVVSLLVGQEGSGGVLTAHQALLEKSPYFKDACSAFTEDGSVRVLPLPPSFSPLLPPPLSYLFRS